MIKDKTIFYIIAVALFGLLLASISGILLPFVLAAVLAYLLDPVVDKFEAKKCNRAVVSIIIVSILFFAIFLLFALAVPVIIDGVKDMNYIIANYESIFQTKILPFIQPLLPEGFDFDVIMVALRDNSQQISAFLLDWLKKLALSTMNLLDLITIFLITPIALYYLLKDWDKMLDIIHTLFPENDQSYISKLLGKIDAKLSSFIRGQLLVCVILGAIYGIGLSLVGLKLGLLIGFVTGLLSFIPYVGMGLGMLTSLIMALIQFPLTDAQPFILIAGVFAFGQLIESAFLSPKLVGDALGLHPLWIIFVVMAGGELGGFMGILVALPISAIISVIVVEVIEYYKKSNIYAKKETKAKRVVKKPAKKALKKGD